MGKTHVLVGITLTTLLMSSCMATAAPTTPSSGAPTGIPVESATVTATSSPMRDPLNTPSLEPEPSAIPRLGPSTINGTFVLTNTSTPGMDVGIETIQIRLEYRLSAEDPWHEMDVACSFNPPAPVVLKDELPVQYECQYQESLPPGAELRATAEVRIFGSDEIFRLEVELL